MRLTTLAVVLAFVPVFPASATAQTRAVPENRAQLQLTFSSVVKHAAPSVVNVYGARVERRQQDTAMDEFLRRFFGEDGRGMPPQGPGQRSLGSGVIVDPSGLVVTNHHVIEGMTEVKVGRSLTGASSRPRSCCAIPARTSRCCG